MERDEQTDYEAKADELERRADELEEPGGEVDSQIKDTRQDWESKKSDTQIPGAMESPRAEDGPEAPVPGVPAPKAPPMGDDEEAQGDEPPRSGEQADAGQ